jgi:gliding motility-associated lipoprotein GldH
MRKIGFLWIIIWLAQSCQSDEVFNKYQTLEKAQWSQDQVLDFEISMQDSITAYNIFINLRNTKDYGFSNLFLITQMTFPNQTQVVDTLEYEMTDASGHFLGSGFSDLKENKLFYKENIRFHQKGNYILEVKHAMRKRNEINMINPLLGVSDVGISIEKVK